MNLFNLFATIKLDSSGYEQAVDQAKAKADKFGDALNSNGYTIEETQAKTKSLSARIEVAAGKYDDAKKEVEKLTKELEEAVDKTGASSEESRKLAESLNKAENEASSFGSELERLKNQYDALNSNTQKGQSWLKGWLSTTAGAMTQANLFASAIEKGIGVIADFASSVWNLDEATEEYRVAQARLNTAYEAAGYDAQTATKAYSGLYKVLGETDRATEAAQLLAKLATNTQDVTTWTRIATGVSGTFGDSLPIEGLIEAANETAKVGQVTGVLADALNWAGISEDEFNTSLARCAGTTERTALITQTLAETYDEASDAFERNSAEIIAAREAQLRLQSAQAGVGKEVSRLKSALSTTLSPALEATLGFVQRLTSGLANMAESAAENTQTYHEMLNAIKQPLPTTSIEEAEVALEKLKEQYQAIADLDPAELTGQQATQYAKLADQIKYGEEQLANMKAGVETTEQALESMTITADGFSVSLQGSGLSAEEATSRLQAYTGAATDMFQAISTESQVSYEQAVANLEANIQATTDFANNLTSIAGSLPPQLAELFSAGGPAVYAGVVSMLAEANAGTDVGLTQLNELWAQGGMAAVEAFTTSLGMVPAETENPATIVAAQMEQDTSMEIAAEGVVDRTYTSLTSAVDSAGFDKAGQTAMNKFIQGMEARRPAVMATARSIARAAANVINSALNSIGTGGGSYRAGGLDYVPYNNYPAMLHAGEAVLTAAEADEWRKGNGPGGGGSIVINQYISAVPQTPVELAAATEAYFEQARWAM